MTCLCCEGKGWLRRLVPHPYVPGSTVEVVRSCNVCHGKGTVPDSGNLFAQDSTKEKIPDSLIDNRLGDVKR